jgi:hypothetical protein
MNSALTASRGSSWPVSVIYHNIVFWACYPSKLRTSILTNCDRFKVAFQHSHVNVTFAAT